MKYNNYFLITIVLFILISCAKEDAQKSIIKEKSLDLQVLAAYEEGMKALNEGDVIFAAKKFNEAEILFPQSDWAPKSALMAAYSYYTQDYYNDAVSELFRFIKVYPNYKDLDYVYYLLETTVYTEEALHRLVEIHYILGLIDEADKYAKLLGYNYQSSKWYEQNYMIFDKKYK